jgi:hypothetical protein
MTTPEEGNASDRKSASIFRDTLSELKQQGGNLLVIGSTHENVHRQVCTQMLGDETAAPRRRLVVLSGSNNHTAINSFSTVQQQSSSIRVIESSTRSRSAVSHEQSEQSQFLKTYTTTGQLSELEEIIFTFITRYETLTDGLAPAELRVCFDSLLTIVKNYDYGTMTRFLRGVTEKIRRFGGLGHFHLPVARETDIIADLTSFFDILVELRVDEKTPQQRWHLCDSGVESEWLPASTPDNI